MNEHYFTADPQSEHDEGQLDVEILQERYRFFTDAGVFSKTEIDFGTQLLITCLTLKAGETILDMGCGYGPLGIVAARLVGSTGSVDLVDINSRAVSLTKRNIAQNRITNTTVWQSDGFSQVTKCYDWIITNPPIRAGKKVIYLLVEQALEHLNPEGTLMLVIRTKQGAKSMAAKMEQVFGNVETVVISKGFRVLKSKNVVSSNANKINS